MRRLVVVLVLMAAACALAVAPIATAPAPTQVLVHHDGVCGGGCDDGPDGELPPWAEEDPPLPEPVCDDETCDGVNGGVS